MDGNPAGSRLHHRLAAGLELMRRCFDRATAPCRHANANDSGAYDDSGAVGADPVHRDRPGSGSPSGRTSSTPKTDTYDFSIYGEDEYDRDTYGDKALVHIFGDDETKSASNQAVLDYKVDQIEAQRAAVHSEDDTCQPSDPCPLSGSRSPRRRRLRPAHLRLQRPRLHIRRQGRGQGRIHSGNDSQEGASPPRRRSRSPSPLTRPLRNPLSLDETFAQPSYRRRPVSRRVGA